MIKNNKAYMLIGLALISLALILGQDLPDLARGLVTGLGIGFLILSTGIEDKCKRNYI
ncbi:hypothetical protein [uncultured Anaerococcus sp.]|uniref:hypothetical protein n=1 Tax=uncultured Anaerococcus sp. TaxID=293428 RepID=UPI002639B433|nr:hypothetical protein [uncultured Anaerococcus sp.]